jgi:hypothetical protein
VLRTSPPLIGALDVRSKSMVVICSSKSSDWNTDVAERAMCFAICFIGAAPECRESISQDRISCLSGALGRNARVYGSERRPLWHIALQATPAHLKKRSQWPTVQSQVSGAPESPRSVGIERLHDLGLGLERSYKRLEEI